ncbi:DLA class II histocompatibility antigen, DR-1 beta chain-like isoform 1-T2 [Pholidichthys leucotaenia]
MNSFLSLPCLFLFFTTADAFFGYSFVRCVFTSTDEYVYLEQYYINKMLMLQYNSTLEQFVGYSEVAEKFAVELNKVFLKQEKKNEKKCLSNISPALDFLAKPVEPTVTLKSMTKADSENVLSCSAWNFYPKQIKLTWLRDGKAVTSNVTSTEELPNGNWLYQIHSELTIIPEPGEKITCMVEHASLMEPKLYDWDPVSASDQNKIAIGAAGLVLGLIFLITGAIFYKSKTNGRVLVPTS